MTTGRIQINDRGELFADELIVGCDMESMLFAEAHNIPAIYTTQTVPHFFEDATREEFAELCFYLSVYGLIPFGDMVDSLRVDLDNKCLNIFCGPKSYKCYYDKLYVYSDAALEGLPSPVRRNKNYRVLDWLDMTSSIKEHEALETESDFVKSIYFYPSLRSVRAGYSDAVAVSYMTEAELADPSWSDTYARLKAMKVMSTAGVVGTKMGSDRHRPLRVSHSHREAIPVGKNLYGDIPDVEFR